MNGLRLPATRAVVCLFVGLFTIGLRDSGVLRALHLWTYDLAVRWQAAKTDPYRDIIVVEIDDYSLKALESAVGRWPWQRSIHAAIIEFCSEARVIGVDILFAEADTLHPGSDEALAKQIEAHGATWLAMQPETHADNVTAVPHRLPPSDLDLPSFDSALLPIPILREAGKMAAVVQAVDEEDGVLRQYGLAYDVAGHTVPSFGLGIVADYLEMPLDSIRLERERGLVLPGGEPLPLTPGGRLRLNPSDELPAGISVATILDAWKAELQGNRSELTRERFRDKIVLIGSTATGLHGDRLVTSLGNPEPGILIHARAIANLLRRDAIGVFPIGWTLLLTLLVGLAPALGWAQRPWLMTLLALGSAAIYAALLRGFMAQGRVVAPVLPLVAFSGSAIAMMVHNWYRERRRRYELEALEKVKQQLTDMLVHDLKNRAGPILTSLSFIDEILLDEDSDEDMRDMIRTALESTDRLILEIRSLLDIRRIDEGKMQLDLASEPIVGMLQAAIAEVQPPKLRDEIELCTHNTGDATISVDALIISRVLLNLLRNAADHHTPDTPIVVSCELRNQACYLAVANECPAVPEEKHASLFDPFVSGGRQGLSGSGLGLAFCKMAIEAHGGDVRIYSPLPGKTTGFKVEMCLTEPE